MRVERSASEAYISSKRSWARTKMAAVAVLQRLEQQAGGESGLADAGRADEDDVLGLGDEVELGEGADLPLGDAGLALEGEGLERPLLGQAGVLDAPGERALLAVLPLARAAGGRADSAKGVLVLVGLGQLARRGSRRSCVRCRLLSSCSRSSVIVVVLRRRLVVRQDEVVVAICRSTMRSSRSRSKRPYCSARRARRSRSGAARVLAQHPEQPAQRERAAAAGVLLERGDVGGERRRGRQELPLLLGRRRRPASPSPRGGRCAGSVTRALARLDDASRGWRRSRGPVEDLDRAPWSRAPRAAGR